MFRPNSHELAWAAGLFDGEGHVRHARRLSRYGTHRVFIGYQLIVGQKTPHVLLRFQTAVGGLGKVYRRKSGLWIFFASSFEDVQAIIAMLWRWLSPVKRTQARAQKQTQRALA